MIGISHAAKSERVRGGEVQLIKTETTEPQLQFKYDLKKPLNLRSSEKGY